MPSRVASGQVELSNTATLIVPARAQARKIHLKWPTIALTNFYVGGPGVTTATGYPLGLAVGGEKEFETAAALYGVVNTGTPDINYVEFFD